MNYFIKKLLSIACSLWVIVTLTFLLMQVLPGDPFSQEKPPPPEIHKALLDHYGLNDPWYLQYGRYLKNIALWDLGPSFKYQDRSVNRMIAEGFPISALLGLEALTLAIGFGVTLGTVAAAYRNRWQDRTAMIFAVIGISVPNFIFATLLQWLFALKLGLLPLARWDSFLHTLLPAVALAMLPMAYIARLVRANMIEVLQQEYIKTAKAKGLSRSQVVIKHALRNAILPVIAYLGQIGANILIGSFIIEKIFAIPGLGQAFVASVANRDYTAIMGTTVFFSLLFLLLTFLVDILYGLIDPRIRRGAL